MIWDFPYSCRNYLANHRAPYFVSLWWSRYLWLHYCVVDIECDESRLGILPFFSLPPFCLFCYHCSPFRSSVLFCFTSLPLFLQFIGEFLFMCRVCCETQFVWANYQLCTHVLLYVLISFLGFIFCIVGKLRVPGTRPKMSTGTRAHEIPEIDTPSHNSYHHFCSLFTVEKLVKFPHWTLF